ncbi:MAG: fibronectin type III domain-containing protein [Candidatus Nomurabacteria bacterium]|nr:MAG: fibronectin type III domain-containing protein [Candidatus Nomurabacteria bacterium]
MRHFSVGHKGLTPRVSRKNSRHSKLSRYKSRYHVQVILTLTVLVFASVFGVAIPYLQAVPTNNTETFTLSSDFSGGVLTDVDVSNDEIKLSGGAENWWDANYQYRRQLTVTNDSAGTAEVGTTATISIDTSALETAGKLRSDRNDWRVVYWNGSSNEELDRVYESTSSTVFAIQATIAGSGGSSSDYYVYYGYSSESSTPPSTVGNVKTVLSMHTTANQVLTSGVTNLGIATDGDYVYMSNGSQLSKLNLDGSLVGTKTVSIGGANRGLGFADGRVIGRDLSNNLYAYDWDSSTLSPLSIPGGHPLLSGQSWMNHNLVTDSSDRIGTVQYASGGMILRRYTISGNTLTWLDDITLGGTYHSVDNHGFTMSNDYLVMVSYSDGWRRWSLPDGTEEVDFGNFGGTGTNTETHPSGMSNPTFIDYNWKTGEIYLGDYSSAEYFRYANEALVTSPTLSVTDGGEVGSLTPIGTFASNQTDTGDDAFINLARIFAWGSGGGDSDTAFTANVTMSDPSHSTLSFELRSASSIANLASATYYSLGSPTSSGAYTLTKGQMDALNSGSGVLPSSVNKYFQLRISFTSSDGLANPSVQDFAFHYQEDNDAPSPPSPVNGAGYDEEGGDVISQTTWYNYPTPYFTWDDAIDGDSSIDGYYVCFGTSSCDPSAGSYVTTAEYTAVSLTSNQKYSLRVKARDTAGNVSATFSVFEYWYDATPPANPSGILPDPAGFTNVNDFDFTWNTGSDAGGSGIAEYCYKTGEDGYVETCTASTSVTGITAYQEGANIFYVRSKDIAGNLPTFYTQVSYYYSANAPSPPQGLEVDPTENTANSFTFTWLLPASYSNPIATYHYSVNALPTASNTTATTNLSVGPGAFATQQGTNIFYVVAKDTAGNVEWDSYAAVEFTANTTAPGIPTGVTLTDSSIRAQNKYSLTLTWDAPENEGSGIDHYVIDRSTTIGCSDGSGTWVQHATTTAEGYFDPNLSNTTTYCYRVKAADNAGAQSATSSIVSMRPEGRFTEPPELIGSPGVEAYIQSATVEWLTDREGSSFVEFGTAADTLDRIMGQDDFVTSHSVTLLDLEPATTYYYRTKYTDQDSNTGYSSVLSFTTADAPSAPTNLSVDPESNTRNSFTFAWDPPSDAGVTIQGYFYSVNDVPTSTNTSFTAQQELGPGAYATRQGENVFYLVAIDEANNVNYDNYAAVAFTATTPAPAIPTGLIITDASNRETEDYSIALKWKAVTTEQAGSLEDDAVTYEILRSTDGDSFSTVANITSTGYLDVDLDNTTEYYYQVKAKDSAGAASAPSTTVSDIPEGRYTTPPEITKGPNVTPDSFEAGIAWETDRDADSHVEYGTNSSLGEEQGTIDETDDHSVQLEGLQPETTYYYRIRSRDQDGNVALSSITTFTTLEAPFVSEVLVSDIRLYDAYINWTTNKATTTSLEYGTTTGYGQTITDTSGSLTTTHTVHLENLTDDTTYNFKPTGVDITGNNPASGNYTFTTLTFPRVENITWANQAEGETEVQWTTNVPTTSQVEYYNETTPAKTQGNTVLTTEHSVLLFGLDDATIYQFQVRGTDQFGYEAISDEQEFRTLEDTTPPVVSNVQVESNTIGSGELSRVQIIVRWTTNEPTSSQVRFGEGNNLSSESDVNPELVYDHLLVVSDLEPARTYNIQAIAVDKAGNSTDSDTYRVLTTRRRDSFLQLVIGNLEDTFAWFTNIGGF